MGRTKKSAVWELSELLEVSFTSQNFWGISGDELGLIINNLKSSYVKIPITGEKPERMFSTSEGFSHYRARVASFIEENTEVSLPVSSLITTKFYNAVLDWYGI